MRMTAGGMTALAVIVSVRPLQDCAQPPRQHDQGDATCKAKPRAEAERAIEPEIRVMLDDEDPSTPLPQAARRRRSRVF